MVSKYIKNSNSDLDNVSSSNDIIKDGKETEKGLDLTEEKKNDLYKKFGFKFSDEQLNAVTWNKGTLSINACAGSGKTTTVCSNIIYKGLELGVDTGKILSITYSNKASVDMQVRYTELVKTVDGRRSKLLRRNKIPNFKTFHAFFKQILESLNGDKLEVLTDGRYNFKLTQQIEDFTEKKNSDILAKIMDYRGNQINKGKSPDGIEGIVINEKKDGFSKDNYFRVIKMYEKLKQKDGVIDFEDMQILVLDILSKEDEKSDKLVKDFNLLYDYVYIDEYQDISPIQKKIFDYLLKDNMNKLTVIGDDDQSIYSFRGSNPRFMMDFKYSYENTKSLFLSINYRCPKILLDKVKSSISKNSFRIAKDMEGLDKDGYFKLYKDDKRMTELVKNVKDVCEDFGYNDLSDNIAILVRLNNQKTIIADILLENNLPVNIGNKNYSMRNMTAYKLLNAIITMIKEKDNDLFSEYGNRIFKNIKLDIIRGYSSPRANNWIDDFINNNKYSIDKNVKTVIERMYNTEDACNLFKGAWYLVKKSIYEMTKRGYGSLDDYIEIKDALIYFSEGYDLDTFRKIEKQKETMLNQFILFDRGVSIVTMHSVKGLEYDVVFLPLLDNDGVFPSKRKLDELISEGNVLEAIQMFEEERRLFYVAWTRSRHTLMVFYSDTPNIFLRECKNLSDDFKYPEMTLLDVIDNKEELINYLRMNKVDGYEIDEMIEKSITLEKEDNLIELDEIEDIL